MPMIAARAQHSIVLEQAPVDDLGQLMDRGEGRQRADLVLGEARGDLRLADERGSLLRLQRNADLLEVESLGGRE